MKSLLSIGYNYCSCLVTAISEAVDYRQIRPKVTRWYGTTNGTIAFFEVNSLRYGGISRAFDIYLKSLYDGKELYVTIWKQAFIHAGHFIVTDDSYPRLCIIKWDVSFFSWLGYCR